MLGACDMLIDVQVVTTVHIFVMSLLAMPHKPSDHAIATKVSLTTSGPAAQPCLLHVLAHAQHFTFCSILHAALLDNEQG